MKRWAIVPFLALDAMMLWTFMLCVVMIGQTPRDLAVHLMAWIAALVLFSCVSVTIYVWEVLK